MTLPLFEAFQKPILVWHGSRTSDIEKFKTDLVGAGYDQEGPGVYFSDRVTDTYQHGETIYEVELTPRRLLNKTKKANRADVLKVLTSAPDLEDTLTNWGEDPRMALRKALEAMMKKPDEVDTFQSVWYDFYHYEPVEFVQQMTTIGYDGAVVEKFHGALHYIIYNPNIIRIVRKHHRDELRGKR